MSATNVRETKPLSIEAQIADGILCGTLDEVPEDTRVMVIVFRGQERGNAGIASVGYVSNAELHVDLSHALDALRKVAP